MNARHLGLIGLLAVALFAPAVLVSDHAIEQTPSVARPELPVLPLPSARGKDLGYYLTIPIDAEQNRKAVVAVRSAAKLAEQAKYTAALQTYDRALTLMPNLGDWLRVFAAGVAASAGDTVMVRQRLLGIDSLLLAEWAWRTRVRAARNARDLAGALQFARGAATGGSIRRRAEAWRMIGELQLVTGDTAAARLAFGNAMKVWPYSDVALEAARLLSALPELSAAEHLQIGRIYLRYGNSKRGLAGLNAYLHSSAAHADTVQAVRYELGRAHFAADDYADARAVLKQVASDSRAADDARLLAARAASRLGLTDQARFEFKQLIAQHSDPHAAARAAFLLADSYHDEQELAAAEQWFRRAAELGGGSETAGVAHMRLVTIALARADTAAAIRRLESYRRAFGRGARHQQASYWLAKLTRAAGHAQLARTELERVRAVNPLSYYGIRAAEQLSAELELAQDPQTTPELRRAVRAALVRIDALQELGWQEAAAFELKRVRDYFAAEPTALLVLAEQLNERGRAAQGIAIGTELLRNGTLPASKRLLRTVYPLPYRELISREAERYDIDPFFMAALIRQESAFNPKAVSGAGAVGLMQVMPSTARVLARRLAIRRFTPAKLHEPGINVRIGARFLSDMLKSWRRPELVLAAYNAGPTRVARWRRLPEAADPELFMERIPFDETRDYVRVVQLNSRVYELLYTAEATPRAGQNQ